MARLLFFAWEKKVSQCTCCKARNTATAASGEETAIAVIVCCQIFTQQTCSNNIVLVSVARAHTQIYCNPRNASHAPHRRPPFIAWWHHTSITSSALVRYSFLLSSSKVHALCFSRTCLKKANLCSKNENDTQNGHDQHGLAPTRGAFAVMYSSTNSCAGVDVSFVRNGFLGRGRSCGYIMAWGRRVRV